jgi:threonyl-tRNA synthetase
MVIGPVIDEGFYYDIAYERPFTPDDMAAIEQRMQQLIEKDYDVIKKVTPRAEVIELFPRVVKTTSCALMEDMPDEQAMGLYFHEEYVDMCRGPHVPNTRFLKSFKLTKLSGAYWRGDAKNEQLQRIYGTAWADKKQLAAYIQRIEEAEKRDHRKIGKRLACSILQEEAPGMVFWHPNGWTLYQVLEQYMRKVQRENGYLEIKTPQVVDRSLWEKVRALGQLRRQHVHHRVGKPRLRHQADELPLPRASVQSGLEELPRAADAPGRVRCVPP